MLCLSLDYSNNFDFFSFITFLFILRSDATAMLCVYRPMGFFSVVELSCVGVPIRDEYGAFSSGVRLPAPAAVPLEPDSVELIDLPEVD